MNRQEFEDYVAHGGKLFVVTDDIDSFAGELGWLKEGEIVELKMMMDQFHLLSIILIKKKEKESILRIIGVLFPWKPLRLTLYPTAPTTTPCINQ